MDTDFRCRCGQVCGRIADVAPGPVGRMTCYCSDCQAFLHQLERADLLDAQGGSDIVQVAPAAITFLQGSGEIVGLRLTPKGLYRWYSRCCRTPLGNTLGPAIPFVGIHSAAFAYAAADIDGVFGPTQGAVWHQFAIGGIPKGMAKAGLRTIAKITGLILGWRISGRTWPHPYFDRATRQPKWPVRVLTPDERQGLEELCGPHPTRMM